MKVKYVLDLSYDIIVQGIFNMIMQSKVKFRDLYNQWIYKSSNTCSILVKLVI